MDTRKEMLESLDAMLNKDSRTTDWVESLQEDIAIASNDLIELIEEGKLFPSNKDLLDESVTNKVNNKVSSISRQLDVISYAIQTLKDIANA